MSNSTLTVKIKTLTPLWTGGVDGTMDRIHETGIIGSLRWWYEAIVRGLGGSACDPTSDSRCPDKDGNYCDACAVFGATGLQRAFRLEGTEWQNDARENRLTVKVSSHPKHRGWYLGRGWMDEGAMNIVPMRLPEGWSRYELQQTLSLTLRLIECWGGIGPKTQQGYGVVRFGLNELDLDKAIQAIRNLQVRKKRRATLHPNELPTLDELFFAKVRFSSKSPQQWIEEQTSQIEERDANHNLFDWISVYLGKNVLPLAPVIRYHLRKLVRQGIQFNGHPNAPARWRLMGVINGFWHREDFGKVTKRGRQWKCENCGRTWQTLPSQWVEKAEKGASLIHISHAYLLNNKQWEFRIWGWIPETLSGGISRPNVLDNLRNWLGVSHQRQWHPAQNGQLWADVHIPNPEVCWFEKEASESTEEYLKALLQSDGDGTIGDSGG